MGEKQVIVTLEDGFGRVQTSIATSLSAPQLMDKIMEIDEQQSTIESERDLFEKYKASAIRDMRDYSDKIIEMQKKVDEQQSTIEKQKRIIKSQDAEISRQYNLCLAMSGILREEFGVYDVFDRTKDKNIKKEDD